MPTPGRALIDLVASLVAGERPPATGLTLLSDMDRTDTAHVRAAWLNISEPSRRALLGRAVELAEDNVDLDFSELARIGMDDDSAEVRRHAIAAAWETNHREIAARIAGLLRSDPDESVRAAAADALRPIVLAREFGSIDERTGTAAIDALRSAAGEAEPSADVRARALESLGSCTFPWVEVLITDAYYGDDRRLQLAAVRAMGESAEARWLELLEEQAQSEEAEFRYEVATSLGAIASEEAVPILTGLLADEDIEVITAAVSALGEIAGRDALESLANFRRNADPELVETVEAAIEAATFLEEQDLLRKKIGLE